MTTALLETAPRSTVLRTPYQWIAEDDMPPAFATRLTALAGLDPSRQMTHLEFIREVIIPLHELHLPEFGSEED
jgi:hypothetical protein